MTRAAWLLLVFSLLATAPLAAQDTTPATRSRERLGQLPPRGQRQRITPLPRAGGGTRDTLRLTVDALIDPNPPPGFSYRGSVEPKTVTVGDRFSSGLAVSVAAGTRVEIEAPKDSADRWRVLGRATVSPRDSARTRYLVVVPMVAWVPGMPDTARTELRLTAPDGTVATVPVTLRLPRVRATLPDDTTKWRVRPPHDVWGPSHDWRMIAALALIALLLLAVIAWLAAKLIRARRKRRVPATARQRALALLERARTSGFIEAGNWKAFYTLVAEALRGLAAALDARWSTDLTSEEVIAEMRAAGVAEDRVEALEHLLRVADLAKFARRGRAPDDARRDLDDARRWVESFAAPEPVAEDATVGVAP
ncbi:MAG TPA: hypothetical protein VF092_31730 [Longimicrobium sp.]